MSDTLRTTRYETIGEHETLSIELPNDIGVVHIRTGNVHGRTGNPVIAVEVVSDTLDTPAADGRMYEPVFNQIQNTIYLVGHTPPVEHVHKFRTIASYPSGPKSTSSLRECSCGEQTEEADKEG